MADRDAILYPYIDYTADFGNCVSPENAREAMDSYMKATCLELLEYIGKNDVVLWKKEDGSPLFQYKGKLITSEQLFENFI